MIRRRSFVCGIFAATAVGAFTSGAVASPSESPPPVPGNANCIGLIVAEVNHDSGPYGPSGNATASAGPGSFLGSQTHPAIESVRSELC